MKVGEKKIYHIKSNHKTDGIPVSVSDKIDFKTRNITKDEEGSFFNYKR